MNGSGMGENETGENEIGEGKMSESEIGESKMSEKDNKRKSVYWITSGAMIAAVYVVLTVVLSPISYGAIQVRIAEALTIMPLFTSAAVPGLFVGCMIANIMGGAVIWDIIFGSLATLIGAAGGWLLRKNRWLVPIPTIVSNTVIIPFVLKFGYGENLPLPLLFLSIAAGEIAGCYILGELLASFLARYGKGFFKMINSKT